MSRAHLGLGAAAVLLVGVDLGTRLLTANDETRFPLLAQDMLDKPPLVAWLIALASWPAGHVTELTAALPSALAALLAAWAVGALGQELFGGAAGRLAALVALTTQGFATFSRIPLPDMVMTACLTDSLWLFIRMTRGAPRAWIGFYGLAGLAFWAKGTVGLMPLVVALVGTAASRTPGRGHALRLSAGALVLVAISREQRFRYYLPLAAPVALLVGWWLTRVMAAYRSARSVFAAAWAVSALGLLITSGSGGRTPRSMTRGWARCSDRQRAPRGRWRRGKCTTFPWPFTWDGRWPR